jgi:hypothetical protein
MLAAAKADLEMERAVLAEQKLCRHRPFGGHGDLGQQRFDQPFLGRAQGLALGAAIEAVDRRGIAGLFAVIVLPGKIWRACDR